MDIDKFKKWYLSLDKETKEFQDVFELVNETYWDFDHLDLDQHDDRKIRKTLNTLATRGEDDMVLLAGHIIQLTFDLIVNKRSATKAEVGIGNKSYYFSITDEPGALEKMQKMIANTVRVKARELTNPTEE